MAEQNEPRMSDIADLGGDRSLVARMEALIREHVKRVKDDDAHLLALFIAVQHREDEAEPCNYKRHVEIINMLSHYPKLTRPRASERLCALAQALYEAKADGDASLAMEALNTIEASNAMGAGGALALFTQICTPTTPEAEALREKYARGRFGERRLKKHVFSKLDSTMGLDVDKMLAEAEAKEDGTWVEPQEPATGWGAVALACTGVPFFALACVWLSVYGATYLFGTSLARELLAMFPGRVMTMMIPAFVHEQLGDAPGDANRDAAAFSPPPPETCVAGACSGDRDGLSIDEL